MQHQVISETKTGKSSKKAILLLIAVFLLGSITGIGGSIMMMIHRLQKNLNHPELVEGPANQVLTRMGDDIENHLDLTDEENKAVREEILKSRDELREIKIKLLQDLRRVTGNTVERIANRLPEAKRKPLLERANERLKPWGLQPEP